jgi:hypothetical protein
MASDFKACFLVFGFWHDVRGEFPDNVSEFPVGPIFTGQMWLVSQNRASFSNSGINTVALPSFRLMGRRLDPKWNSVV